MCSYLVKFSLVLSDSIDFVIIAIIIDVLSTYYSETALGTVMIARL